jgi:hypothetical protein
VFEQVVYVVYVLMEELKVINSDIVIDESVWRIISNDFNLLTNVILEPDILTRRNLLL